MSKFAIDLTAEEGRLLDIIELDQGKVTHDNYEKNASAVLSLMKLLGQREAFPELLDRPKYHLGRIKSSHKGLFERNGCTGTEIYKHPHFLSYLYYFLFGASLPELQYGNLKKRLAIRVGLRPAT